MNLFNLLNLFIGLIRALALLFIVVIIAVAISTADRTILNSNLSIDDSVNAKSLNDIPSVEIIILQRENRIVIDPEQMNTLGYHSNKEINLKLDDFAELDSLNPIPPVEIIILQRENRIVIDPEQMNTLGYHWDKNVNLKLARSFDTSSIWRWPPVHLEDQEFILRLYSLSDIVKADENVPNIIFQHWSSTQHWGGTVSVNNQNNFVAWSLDDIRNILITDYCVVYEIIADENCIGRFICESDIQLDYLVDYTLPHEDYHELEELLSGDVLDICDLPLKDALSSENIIKKAMERTYNKAFYLGSNNLTNESEDAILYKTNLEKDILRYSSKPLVEKNNMEKIAVPNIEGSLTIRISVARKNQQLRDLQNDDFTFKLSELFYIYQPTDNCFNCFTSNDPSAFLDKKFILRLHSLSDIVEADKNVPNIIWKPGNALVLWSLDEISKILATDYCLIYQFVGYKGCIGRLIRQIPIHNLDLSVLVDDFLPDQDHKLVLELLSRNVDTDVPLLFALSNERIIWGVDMTHNNIRSAINHNELREESRNGILGKMNAARIIFSNFLSTASVNIPIILKNITIPDGEGVFNIKVLIARKAKNLYHLKNHHVKFDLSQLFYIYKKPSNEAFIFSLHSLKKILEEDNNVPNMVYVVNSRDTCGYSLVESSDKIHESTRSNYWILYEIIAGGHCIARVIWEIPIFETSSVNRFRCNDPSAFFDVENKQDHLSILKLFSVDLDIPDASLSKVLTHKSNLCTIDAMDELYGHIIRLQDSDFGGKYRDKIATKIVQLIAMLNDASCPVVDGFIMQKITLPDNIGHLTIKVSMAMNNDMCNFEALYNKY